MRTLVLWANGDSTNLGVRALAAGTAALVDRAFPGTEFAFHSFGRSDAPVPTGRLDSFIRERITNRLGMRDWLRTFDLVVDTRAGDSLTDTYGLRRLTTMSAVADGAKAAGVPLLLGPQTIGPFITRRGRWFGRHSLRRADAVLARDSASAAEATRLGRRPDAVTSDVVFALPTVPRSHVRDVLLNISGLLWNPNPHVDHLAYRSVVAEVHAGLVADGRTVSLLAHVVDSPDPDNDVPAIREFAAQSAPDAEVIVPGDLGDVRRAVAGAALVIGSRMHACLNGLSVGTPSIPLAYSRKFIPLLSDAGWSAAVDLRTDDDPAGRVLALSRDDALTGRAEAVRLHASASLGRGADVVRSLL